MFMLAITSEYDGDVQWQCYVIVGYDRNIPGIPNAPLDDMEYNSNITESSNIAL